MDAAALFENTMELIRQRGTRHFRVENDIVLDVKARMESKIAETGLPYRVAKERILPGGRADLALLDGESVAVAVEFKYEPKHTGAMASDDVVQWSEVEADIRKVQKYVGAGVVGAAYAILIDADGRWRSSHPNAPEGSEWRDWGNGAWTLWTKVGGDSSA